MSNTHFMIPSNVSQANSAKTISTRLKHLRLQKNLSQRDLSSPKISYTYISQIETGARNPSVKALRKLTQKLKISIEYLKTDHDIHKINDHKLRLANAELELRLNGDNPNLEQKLEQIRT